MTLSCAAMTNMYLLIPAAVLLSTSCGSPPPTYWADAKPILDGRCVSCHSPGEVAPFALNDYSAAADVARLLPGVLERRVMPPWLAAPGHRSYEADPSLTEEQLATLLAWEEAGAPEGEPTEEGDGLLSVYQALDRVDNQIPMQEPYVPGSIGDEYRCFVLHWPEDGGDYVTGFNALPGNRAVVHHIAAFLMPPDTLMGEGLFETLDEWEAIDPEPGYTCFGGPAGAEGVNIPAQQLAQWVPGGGAFTFPEGTGIPIPARSRIVLQMHYFSAGPNPAPDTTTLEFRTEDEVEHRAAFAPWLDVGWVSGSMDIPALAPFTEHSVQGDPRGFFRLAVGDLELDAGFRIHAALMHMHRLGVMGEIVLVRGDGSEEVVLEIPEWDFDWQINYILSDPLLFEDGDELRVRCVWDNSAENQPMDGDVRREPRDVNWGEGTVDEMCVGNLYISEL